MDSLTSKLPDNTIEYIGIGSLHFLGIFMIIDRYTAWYGWVEVISRAAIWAVVAAIPALFFSYIIGFISIVVSDFLFSISGLKKRENEITEFLKVALSDNFAIIQNYLETNKSKRILSGVALGFLMVAAGVFIRISGLAAPYPANIYFAFRIMGFGAILLATICIGLAISLTKRNELLVNKLDEISKPDKQKRSKK